MKIYESALVLCVLLCFRPALSIPHETQELRLSIVVPDRVCRDSARLPVEVFLTNTSQESVVVGKEWTVESFAYSVAFDRNDDARQESGVLGGDSILGPG